MTTSDAKPVALGLFVGTARRPDRGGATVRVMSDVRRPATRDDAEVLVALMRRYLAGELVAFEQLYALTSGRVMGYVMTMTRDRARAEDLCQVTYLKLHRAREGWIDGAPLMPWLLAIARNAFLDDARRRKRKPERPFPDGVPPDRPDPRPPPKVGLGQAIDNALASLPERQRDAFALTYRSGLSHREGARVLGTTQTAVKLLVHRALKVLREALRPFREEGS